MHLSLQQLRFLASGRRLLRKFIADRCTTYAAALAYCSMLSIIPSLAILFAILKALDVHTALTPIILANVSAGSQDIVKSILHYVDNTSVGSVGAIGLITLTLSILTTLDTIEEAFNQVWSIERGKAFRHKLGDYLLIIFGVPILLAVAVTITTGLQHQGVLQWFFEIPGLGNLLLILFRLVPYLSLWVALVFLYTFIPNTRVKLKYALVGSLLAGTLWQLTQWSFIHFQIGVSHANAIYGTLALLPVFMLWIYTGWLIVLGGMEFICHLQHERRTTGTSEGSHRDDHVTAAGRPGRVSED